MRAIFRLRAFGKATLGVEKCRFEKGSGREEDDDSLCRVRIRRNEEDQGEDNNSWFWCVVFISGKSRQVYDYKLKKLIGESDGEKRLTGEQRCNEILEKMRSEILWNILINLTGY